MTNSSLVYPSQALEWGSTGSREFTSQLPLNRAEGFLFVVYL